MSAATIIKPRHGRVADAEAVHALLWAARHDIGLTEKFITEPYVERMRDYCRDKRVWLVERDGTIAGAMLLQPSRERRMLSVFHACCTEQCGTRGNARKSAVLARNAVQHKNAAIHALAERERP